MTTRTNQRSAEHFKFDVSDWKFEYGFHVNIDAGPRDPLGMCWEGHYLTVSGPLRSKTKRKKCSSVKVTLMPMEIDPAKWSREKKGFGSVEGVRRGVLIGHAVFPSLSFHSFLTALSAGKVERCYLSLRDVVRGAGIIDALFTLDPKTDEDDET
jgi:hypothetical protein